jgi:hypothetical protein
MLYSDDGQLMTGVVECLTKAAREVGADAIVANGLLLNQASPPAFLARWLKWDSWHVFACKDATQGWQYIAGKKSVRRHLNAIRRGVDYLVEVKTGNAITTADVAFVIKAHSERWQFAGHLGCTDEEQRIRDYSCHIANKILMIIRREDDWVALHYGLRYGSTLVWHTPVINVKYLDSSPLEVLLGETAFWCADNGIDTLDFSLGEDEYKTRFANQSRGVWHLLIPISPKGHALSLARKLSNTAEWRSKVKAIVDGAKRCRAWSMARLSKIHLYTSPTDTSLKADHRLKVIRQYQELVDVLRMAEEIPTMAHYQRMKQGGIFLGLFENNKILSSGWASDDAVFYISEIDTRYALDGALMLYDFHTSAAQRNKGHYTALLRAIRTRFQDRRLLIFASIDNHASNKGIIKAGFMHSATISHCRSEPSRVQQ